MRFPAVLISSNFTNWNLKIKELLSNGKWRELISQFQEMKKAGVQSTDPAVFPPILKACLNFSCKHGKSIHASVIKQGFVSFVSIGNSIMDFYIKSGDLDSAVSAFECLRGRDSISWNIMVHGHLDRGVVGQGLWWFSNARAAGFEPNISTLVLVIQACSRVSAELEGLKLHCYVIQSGFWASCSVQNSLLSMYADVDIDCAHKLFDEICDKDVISWSVMIRSYVQSGEAESGLHMFKDMVSVVRIEPDGVTMVGVLKACADLVNKSMGRLLHVLVIRGGLDSDLFVQNSLIDMYSKCNDSDSASKVFEEMPRKNIVSWNSVLSGFVLNDNYSGALTLIRSMANEGVESDEVTLVNILQTFKHFVHPTQCKSVHCVIVRRGFESNELLLSSLIDAYAKCCLIELAWRTFVRMKRRDTVSWSTMIAGFTLCGKPDEAIAVFQEMNREKVKPNAVTIINLLEACSVSSELKRSKWAHGIAVREFFAEEVSVGTAIVDMYSKCGVIEASKKAFDLIPKKNLVSWSAMISAYGMNGLAHEALHLLAGMEQHGVKPNSVTALSVLSACSHGGLVEEGLFFFKSMVQDQKIEPCLEHYSCIIDMLARAGKLNNAAELIRQIPKPFQAASPLWGALLSSCRSYKNSMLGAEAVSHLIELEPLNPSSYMLASSIYAAGGLWDDAAKMRGLVKERGLKVVAGYSLVYVDNKACRFIAGDKSHPQASQLSTMVEQLHSCMKINKNNNLV
ncbi:pentatricopeptide repeat-containing protein [Tripterygium wilfordii]|uniref:Pentatricopeptide repeat-containing protein n=1 Tax=Tripterygium wilfordii TaxID=458696 RepID=A0A7J7D205_TRIWF|nr:pentatricopeptide repeat-containing protein At2g17210 [Tripterygium wilfordii]XP_038716463.1 pentatricopeptide repeat-containing protein At2g17210 [Tripterygium wilfordii]KAF5740360.1 pentatricopeptide repeat-containing protein [Tripterygium wilfordii]